MGDVAFYKALVALACVGSCVYSLHRGWKEAAGWLGLLSFFAVLGAVNGH